MSNQSSSLENDIDAFVARITGDKFEEKYPTDAEQKAFRDGARMAMMHGYIDRITLEAQVKILKTTVNQLEAVLDIKAGN